MILRNNTSVVIHDMYQYHHSRKWTSQYVFPMEF